MKNFDFDKTWIGIVLGLIAPVLGFFIYYFYGYSYMPLHGFINYIRMGETYTPLISLCVLANLAAFYPFIWKEKYKGAKGVLGATFFWAAVIVYLKFFT